MTQLPQAIAWTLIHFCWQAAAIAAAISIASLAIARRSSQARYLVALSALLLMLVAAVVTFAWELRTGSTTHFNRRHRRQSSRCHLQQNFRAPPRLESPQFSKHKLRRMSRLATLLPWIDGLWLVGVFALCCPQPRRLVVSPPPAPRVYYRGSDLPFAPASSASRSARPQPRRHAASLHCHRQPHDHGRSARRRSAPAQRRHLARPRGTRSRSRPRTGSRPPRRLLLEHSADHRRNPLLLPSRRMVDQRPHPP